MRGLVPGMLLLVAALPQLHLLERNHPRVEEGMAAYARGEFEQALKHFEAARAELPGEPAVELNRGNALYRLGRLEEAKQAYLRAAELDDGRLKARDHYNLGTALAQMGERDAAIAALRKALLEDPSDKAARHNLEVLLRRIPPRTPSPSPDGGTDQSQDAGPDAGPDGGSQDAGTDGGQDGGQDAGSNDGGSDGGAADAGRGGSDGGTPDGGDAGRGEGTGERPGDGGEDGGAEADEPDERDAGAGDAGAGPQEAEERDGGSRDVKALPDVSREEAERTLDAMRQNERNLESWRFQQRRRPRRPNDKDW